MHNGYFTGVSLLSVPNTTASPCIFRNLTTYSASDQNIPRPIPCSNEKIHTSAILCEAHFSAYFNLGIKREEALPSDSTIPLIYYALKFTAAPDSIISFPMKLKPKKHLMDNTKLNDISDFEFCLDQEALNRGFSGFANYLPPQVLGTLLTNSALADHFMTDWTSNLTISPGVGQAYMPILIKNSMVLENHYKDVYLFARSEKSSDDDPLNTIRGDNQHIRIPMNMLPGFYKFLFYYAGIATLSTPSKNQYQVKQPNLILNLDTQAFEIVNKSSSKKVYVYKRDGTQTVSTNVVLSAERIVSDIHRANGIFNISTLISNVPVCHT